MPSNQVLRLLEDVGLPELVIQLASLAITEAANDVNSQVSQRSLRHVFPVQVRRA